MVPAFYSIGIRISAAILLYMLTFNALLLSQWTKVPFAEGGNVKAITRDSSGYIYIGGSNGRLYRSSDNGNSWSDFTNGITYSVTVLISTPNCVLAGTSGNGFYRSTNHGLTWFQSNTGLTNNFIMCATKNSAYLFVGTQNSIFRSSNDGVNWQQTSSNLGIIEAIESYGNSTLFASAAVGSSGSMYLSTDNGSNWSYANSGLPVFFVYSIASTTGKVYAAGGNNFLYQTTNLGQNWTFVTNLPSNSGIVSVSSSLSTVVVTKYDSCDISTDAGTTWISSSGGLPNTYVNFCLIAPTYLMAATGLGMWKSTNGGVVWFSTNNGFTNYGVSGIISQGASVLLATSSSPNFFFSSNNGTSWMPLASYGPNWNFQYYGNKIYGVSQDIYCSTNWGINWTELNVSGGLASIFSIKDSIIYVSSQITSNTYRSFNLGISWSAFNPVTQYVLGTIGCIQILDTTVFLSADTLPYNIPVLFVSSLSGNSWLKLSNTGLSSIANIMRKKGSIYIAGTGGGMFVSTDYGYSWLPKNNGFPNYTSVTDMLVRGDSIFVSTTGYGVYLSNNNCNSWTSFNQGLNVTNIYNLAGNNNTLYAGSTSSLWRFDFPVGISSINTEQSVAFSLNQNFPNPFNPSTVIEYNLPKMVFVRIAVYDITGKLVTVLLEKEMKPGRHMIDFDAKCLASGVYFYTLEAGDMQLSRKMIIMK